MNREVHVRFSEGPTVKLHRSTYSTEEAQDFLYFQTNTREKGSVSYTHLTLPTN